LIQTIDEITQGAEMSRIANIRVRSRKVSFRISIASTKWFLKQDLRKSMAIETMLLRLESGRISVSPDTFLTSNRR